MGFGSQPFWPVLETGDVVSYQVCIYHPDIKGGIDVLRFRRYFPRRFAGCGCFFVLLFGVSLECLRLIK